MNADNKLVTTVIQMPCFEITLGMPRLLSWRVFFWASSVCEALLLCSESVDMVVFEDKLEVCVLFSRSRISPIIPSGRDPFPEFGVGLLVLLWVSGKGRRVPRWLLGMIGNPRWSHGALLLFPLPLFPLPLFSFWSSVCPVKFKADRPVGLGVFLRLVDQPETGQRLKVVATVGTPVVVTFCTWVALGGVMLWSRFNRCAWLIFEETKKKIGKMLIMRRENTLKRVLVD